jgi:hypothetical protein
LELVVIFEIMVQFSNSLLYLPSQRKLESPCRPPNWCVQPYHIYKTTNSSKILTQFYKNSEKEKGRNEGRRRGESRDIIDNYGVPPWNECPHCYYRYRVKMNTSVEETYGRRYWECLDVNPDLELT